jgi:two-component system, cell cycle sensor histidine kinase and response regulator CckA
MEALPMNDDAVHILLIEDEMAHAELVARAFEMHGDLVRLDVARSLAEARTFLERQSSPPDLIIADWRLPDGESLELLPSAPGSRAIPIIIMTSHGNERVAVDAMKFGALDYVVKSDITLLEMPHIAKRALRQWQDIIERKRAEEALRESEARYRLITENANDMICLLDRQGAILYLSPSVESLLGYEPAELLGTRVFDLIHPDDLDRVREHWAQLDLRRAQITYRVRHSNASWRWFDAQGALIERETEHYIVMVGRDITERRQLEAQLIQVQKLDAIGQLAGGLAHDFNNLLVVISGCAELASVGSAPDNPVQHELNEILKATQRAASLTRQLLTFARRQISEPKPLNLNDLIRDLDRMLRRLIPEDITLVGVLAPDLWHVYIDPGQFEQVVVNLVVNARDAMPQGGQLTITTANIVLDRASASPSSSVLPGSYVLLSVADTGIGMSEEIQRHAFEPFFTTKGPGQGTGLGLATCYGIVKQHNGTIYLSSEVGRGTTIYIYLPRVQNTLTIPRIQPEAEPLPRGTETVLLVEDDAAVRALLGRVLRAQGYAVLEAEHGLDALDIATRPGVGSIDLLLTDMVVPHINGHELAERLQRNFPHLRLLFMSGYVDKVAASNEQPERRAAFIQKPFTATALAHKVRQALDG